MASVINSAVGAPMSAAQCLKVLFLIFVYISASGLLTFFNKFLMRPERFPYPITLATFHMGFSFICCLLIYAVWPSGFPGLEASKGRRVELARWFAPLGIMFACSLTLQNLALSYCGVGFVQFMKEGNVVVIFLLAWVAGLQTLNRVKMATIMWIMLGTALCVTKEVNFVWLGFLVQLCGQFSECLRLVLGDFMLNGRFKLDPLTYTLFAAPSCLLALAAGHIFVSEHEALGRAATLWYYLLPNTLLAFSLNLLTALVLGNVSSVGLCMTGLVKDMALVLSSAILFGEHITHGQYMSFSVTLSGIMFWSLLKTSPEHPLVRKVEAFMGLEVDGEKVALVKRDADIESTKA